MGEGGTDISMETADVVLMVILNGMRLIRFNRKPVKEQKGRVEVTLA